MQKGPHMTTYQILCILGVQAFSAAIVSALVAALISKNKTVKAAKEREEQEFKILRYAIQAILRDRLCQLYKRCKDKKCASMEERRSFENMYKWYHSLGENGVMDDTRKKFLSLPIEDED